MLKKINFPSSIAQLMRHIQEHWRLAIIALFTSLGTTALFAVEPRVLGWIVDNVLLKSQSKYRAWAVSALLVLVVLRFLGQVIQNFVFSLLGQKVALSLRDLTFQKILALPISEIEKHSSAFWATRLVNDLSNLANMFTDGVMSLIGNGILVLGIVVGLFLMDVRLAFWGLLIFPVVAVISYQLSLKLRATYQKVRDQISGLNVQLAESLNGFREISLLNVQEKQISDFKKLNEELSDSQCEVVRLMSYLYPLLTVAAGLSVALVIFLGGQKVQSGSVSAGVWVAFFAYLQLLYQPLKEIADRWNTLMSGLVASERVFDVLNLEEETSSKVVSALNPKLDFLYDSSEILSDSPFQRGPYPSSVFAERKKGFVKPARGEIEFQNVWFYYESEDWVLKDLSFKISAGEKIGLVGATGAGKSTIVQLLLKFYIPQKGKILVDGKELSHWDTALLRKQLGWIQQDVFLFGGTIRDNMGLFREIPNEIYAKLESSKVAPNLFCGRAYWHRSVGANGALLSSGEKQIIAFSRAMSVRPAIWLMDEATSHVDLEAEKRLQSLLVQNVKESTLIIIAHRLSTLSLVDRILVMNHGRLVEEGRHEQLMAKNGIYAHYYRLQSETSTYIV